MRILAINPGSTSTKIGAYHNDNMEFEETIRHSASELAGFGKVTDQYEFRKNVILQWLRNRNIDLHSFEAVVARGGLLKPIPGGTYLVNDAMLEDLHNGVQGEHASNLGGLIASEIAKSINKKAYIVDPVVVDELTDIARVTGHPEFKKHTVFHALNQKAIANAYAEVCDKPYTQLNLIVAHLGGGVSIGAHKNGRVIDVNNCLDGDGPFSPERSGSLPVGELVRLCFDGKHTQQEIESMIKPKGGLFAYFNTTDVKQLYEDSRENCEIKMVLDAMLFQIAKEIGAAATVLKGNVDAILLTGGLCYGKEVVAGIKERVEFIAPVKVYPGEDELKALCQGVLRVLNNKEAVKMY